jgi:hypothetical protein
MDFKDDDDEAEEEENRLQQSHNRIDARMRQQMINDLNTELQLSDDPLNRYSRVVDVGPVSELLLQHAKTPEPLQLLEDDEPWDERNMCPPACVVVSERYGLVVSPRGTVYSTRVASTPEEEEQQMRDYEAWLAEVNPPQEEDPCEDLGGLRARIDYNQGADEDPHAYDLDGEEEEHNHDVSRDVGRKRRQPVLLCHYNGCRKPIEQMPLTCPSTVEGQRDLPHLFCSYGSMLAWAFYDVGAPLCYRLEALINQRAGYEVVADPPIYGDGAATQGSSTTKTLHLDPDEAQQSPLLRVPMAGEDEDGEGMDVAEDAIQKLVPCRLCLEERLADDLVLRVNLDTAATWAFCSDDCASGHPKAIAGDLMHLDEFNAHLSLGRRTMLEREGWGTEPSDV